MQPLLMRLGLPVATAKRADKACTGRQKLRYVRLQRSEDPAIIWDDFKMDSWIEWMNDSICITGPSGSTWRRTVYNRSRCPATFRGSCSQCSGLRGVLAGLWGSPGPRGLIESSCGASLMTLKTICPYSLLVIGVHTTLCYSLGRKSRGEEGDRLPRRVLTFLPSLRTPNVVSTEFDH
jgi:hypothetical protein